MREILQQTKVVPATAAQLWEAFTTRDGVRSFFAPEASIELRPGGLYELYFAPELPVGLRGGEGCTVVELEPARRFVFTWNFPPSLPSLRDAKQLTTIELLFDERQDDTLVTLTQRGWREGEDWERGYQYFERAWGIVLERLHQRFAVGPIDWSVL